MGDLYGIGDGLGGIQGLVLYLLSTSRGGYRFLSVTEDGGEASIYLHCMLVRSRRPIFVGGEYIQFNSRLSLVSPHIHALMF